MPAAATIEKALKLGVSESETLDQKREPYTDNRDWLKDVTAFANTTGGRILIGVEEDEHGRATAAPGFVPSGGMDQEIQKLNNWLRTLSEPDVSTAVRITAEEDDAGKHFLVVDVEESGQAPHRVTIKSEKVGRQVYVRKGRDSVPASMAEIRDIVIGANRTPRLISEFVEERRRVFPNSNPIGAIGQYVAFHVAPRRGFGSRALVDYVLAHPDLYLGDKNWNWANTRPNMLGAVAAATPRSNSDPAYHQVFYNGAAELVTTHLVVQIGQDDDAEKALVVPGRWLQLNVEKQLAHMLSIMQAATGCDQFEVATTFGGVAGMRLHWKEGDGMFAEKQSAKSSTPWESPFVLPTVTVRMSADGKATPEDLRQILDLIWRAWGEAECPI